MNDNKLMNRAADNIRILAASMVEKANSGHPGGAMGGADFVMYSSLSFWCMIPKILHGKVVTASSWTRVTCHRCSTLSWHWQVNSHWMN